MYHVAVSFDVPAVRREDFIKAALKDGENSIATEPRTLDVAGRHFAMLFEEIKDFAVGPTFLIQGTRVVKH